MNSTVLDPQLAAIHPATMISRRRWLESIGGMIAAGAFASPLLSEARRHGRRAYHLCLNPVEVLRDPELIEMVRQAGVQRVWLAAFFYGHWPYPMETISGARDCLRRAGLEAALINVPLGHPGDSLDARDGSFPLTPPSHWQLATAANGRRYAGTSLHAPATDENVRALQRLKALGLDQCFLDDDFRLAPSPGQIGGCFCADHRARFLRRTGFSPGRWDELLDDVRARRVTPVLREWVESVCDELSASFRAQRRAFGHGLGIMVMYFGAEKAGIRLRDYRGVPFRVGETMFDDAAFAPLKGKTDELFSVLFHRRFVAPDQAYSETTAFPADRLSARHMAAKLVLSTLADVRNSMFMSGLTPFPKAHWSTLASAMKRQATLHERVAGQVPRGPFKHFWGDASRYAGSDQPFSLFLASGVPFEVTDRLGREGWTFLSDADAAMAAQGRSNAENGHLVCRPGLPSAPERAELCPETMQSIFAFKHRIRSRLSGVPLVENEVPAILAWYPSIRAALLWNPDNVRKTFRLRFGSQVREVEVEGLDLVLVDSLRPPRTAARG